MKIKDICSKNIISINSNDSIKEASKYLKKHNIGILPVIKDKEYVGVITDRDIALSLPYIKSLDDKIESYMSKNIISIDYNDNVDEALELMSKYKIKRLLVKDKEDYIGVLSLSDILHSTYDNDIIQTFKIIFYTTDNEEDKDAEIDDFYL